MDEKLFNTYLELFTRTETENTIHIAHTVLSDKESDDISYFFPPMINSKVLNNDHSIGNTETRIIEQIQNQLALLTKSITLEEIEAQINNLCVKDVFPNLEKSYKNALKKKTDRIKIQQRIQTSLTNKLQTEKLAEMSIFAQMKIHPNNDSQRLSFFAIQSLTSILLILIKSAQKYDPNIVQEILTLTSQLCEELPMKCLTSLNYHNVLFKSLKPLINYMQELLLSNDPIQVRQVRIILLSFSIAKGSFKDILPLLTEMIFDTVNSYNIRGILNQLNNGLQEINKEENHNSIPDQDNILLAKQTSEEISLAYLKSIGEYPNSELIDSDEKIFTGQYFSSILLSHIEYDDQLYSLKRLEQGSLESSFSFEFHSKTFQILFDIIEQLSTIQSSTVIIHILTVCLRLFTTHLTFLSMSKIDVLTFANHDQLTKWFHLFLKIACDEGQKNISVEASKIVICLINLPTWSFIDKLSFIHQYIEENRYAILIEQLFIELNREETILNWIELLCDEKSDKAKALEILYSFIDQCFISSRITKLLSSFQKLLIYHLVLSHASSSTSSLVIQYITFLFKYPIEKQPTDLINSILIYLSLMTQTNEIFDFITIQPIFVAILPLLSEFLIQKTDNDQNKLRFISWLLGKMTQIMITNSPLNSLELKHADKLKLILFAGGCEKPSLDTISHLFQSNLAIYSQFHLKDQEQKSSSDEKFLLSIYLNIDQGAQLISKIKKFAKNKQHLLQKSIEQQANELSAAVFAVYIKHYRRINLARYELSQSDQTKPSMKLISIFDCANHVQTLLATVKAQGNDCEVFVKQIKSKTLFLLKSVKENNLISIINEVITSLLDIVPKKEGFPGFQRQVSQWTKAKQVIELLRNLMETCIRFRKSLLSKRYNSDVKFDYESLLNRTIDQFIYGDFYKMNTSISNEDTDLILDELEKCLYRQYERAITRLITYRFAQRFIQKICNLTDQHSSKIILIYYLPYLRSSPIEWSYLENISAGNNQLKDEIRKTYHLIIKTILFESNLIQQHIFYLLNLNYAVTDMNYLCPEIFFKSFNNISLNLRLTAFNWFRLFVFKLCENIQREISRGVNNEQLEQQRTFVFNELILNELRKLKARLQEDKSTNNSLKNISLGWFHQVIAIESSVSCDKLEIDLYINQYLALLFRCIHFYEHIQHVCANVDFFIEFIDIYHQSKHQITRLLVLKILRELIPHLSEKIDVKSRILIEKFFEEILFTIGESCISSQIQPEIVTELINIYRTILSVESPWQIMATEMISKSNLETNGLNRLIGSLCVLGGYIQPHSLSSIVQVSNDDEYQLALILDVSDDFSYSIQYLQTNQIISINADRIGQEIIVAIPDLLTLPTINNTLIDSMLDILGNLIQINSLTTDPLMMLQLKRRSIAVLCHMLKNQKIVEMFLEKPYAITLAKLAISDSLPTTCRHLRLFNRESLEQYYFILKNHQQWKDEKNSSNISDKFNPLIVQSLSTSVLKYNGWKPYVSKDEMQLFKKGRLGNHETAIVSMPCTAADSTAIQQCGTKHRFNGRVNPTGDNIHVNLPTFIIANIQVNEGNWYYCVRLPKDGVQIGWATHGFNPRGSDGKGIGDDEYSWAYDGSRGLFLNDGTYDKQFNDIRWNENDVCGCGIEIDGENIRIKYWLNGKLLGTAFEHQKKIPQSYSRCNLLPNEQITPFYPGVSLQFADYPSTYCEFIFSPEDMQQCPLPDGYKPLLLPKLIDTENSIVGYPFNAYLVGDKTEDYMYQSRTIASPNLLRDFVNGHHLVTQFVLIDHHLMLTTNSSGFPLSINDDPTSLTIAFDFQLSTIVDEQLSIVSFVSDTTEVFTLKIPFQEIDNEIRIVLIFHLKENQTKIYMNHHLCQTFETSFSDAKINPSRFYLLPKIESKIRNIATWKYALPEDHIQRLFTYGLFYVAIDYQQMTEYQKRANTFSFESKEFTNECLIPFDQPFEKNLWEIRKKRTDKNEMNYFSATDPSIIEFFGNKTYLVLEKSIETWYQYTLILDISIPKWPNRDNQLSLITLNDKSRIFIADNGKLYLQSQNITTENRTEIITDDFFRLWITVKNQSIEIYINGSLEINLDDDDDRYDATWNHFDFFREINLTKNTTDENTIRIQCRTITFLNDKQIQIPDQSLEQLVAPPLSIIAPNLIAIGYKKQWIQSVIEESKANMNIQMIDTILREQKERFLQSDLETQQKTYGQILSRILPEIDFSNVNINEPISAISERILTEWTDDSNQIKVNSDDDSGENPWFHRSIKGLIIVDTSLTTWLRDRSTTVPEPDTMRKLLNLNQQTSRTKNQQKLIQYSHETCLTCENGLATIYARHAILTMLEVWSNDSTNLFPPEKVGGDASFIVTFFKLMDYHSMPTEEKSDRMSTLIYSIIKSELKQVLEYPFIENKMNTKILQSKAPVLLQLRNNILVQSLQYLFEPSIALLEDTSSDTENIIDEQTIIEQPNVKFIFKFLTLFLQLLKDKTAVNKDCIVSLLFPPPLIKIMFDLFLIIPIHQFKISILHIFATLTQLSKNFQLNSFIQDFLIELLITLTADETKMNDRLTKNLQSVLMDLVYLFCMKQQSSSRLTDLPKHIRDLFTVVDVINVLIDRTQQTRIPEVFFIQSKDLLGNVLQLTRDDFDRCNKFFDINADQQLISAMNKSLSQNSSFGEFIRNIPTEFNHNATFYQTYLFLSNIPTDCLLIRAKFFYQLNKLIEKILSMVDLNLSLGESVLSDEIRAVKIYLLTTTKFELFKETLEKTETDHNYDTLQIEFHTIEGSVTADKTMFHQAYRQLHTDAQTIFRRPNDQLWQARYVGMHSTDAGGPYRDSITQICSDICSTRLSLFILCPNGRTNSGLNRDCWIPNTFPPNKSIPNKFQKQYRFIGQLLGLAIRKKHYLNVKFPPLFWKELLRESLTFDDIQTIDIQSFTMIDEIEKNIEQTRSFDTDSNMDYLFHSLLGELRFDVVSSAGETYELIPGGIEIPITAKNFQQYCVNYRNYRLNEFSRQIELIRQGLSSVVPCYYLSLFTADELEKAVCGEGEMNIQLLKRNTKYGNGYKQDSPIVERFWIVLNERFNEEQKKLFLIFVWGRSILPNRDEDFTTKFTIDTYDVDDGDIDKTLPRSHTCSFTIDLPKYSTIDIMYERLNYAITYCSSIDNDGIMNEVNETIDHNQEDSSEDEQH